MKKWFIFFSLFFIFGCSASAIESGSSTVHNDERSSLTGAEWNESTIPDIIYISFYSAKHAEKSQPMLTNVVSDKDELKVFHAILQARVEAELKIDEVTDVYYLQLDYQENGESHYRDFLYVLNAENKSYVKEITMSSLYGYDDFDEESKASLLDSIGNEGWLQLKSLLPI